MLTFWLWVALLTAMLYYPVSQLVWVLSVRRLQRRLGRPLDDRDLAGQRQRARFIAVLLCFVFSFLFNAARLGLPTHG